MGIITKLTSCKVCDMTILVEWYGNEYSLSKVLETILCTKCEEEN